MFEAVKPTAAATDTVVPAVAGYTLVAFTFPNSKPSVQSVAELVAAHSWPILAWKLKAGRLEPLTFTAIDPAFERRFVFGSTRIYSLDDARIWLSHDQWSAIMFNEWSQRVPVPQSISIIPGRKAQPVTYA